MSIEDEIKDRVARGMLYPLLPQAAGQTVRRAMLVSEPLWRVLDSPEGDEEWEQRVGELRADLEMFVTGEPIHPKFLFLLYPTRDGIWEIRSTDDDPSIRVLGLFAQKDTYIAVTYVLRQWLGGWQSRDWKIVKRLAGARWRVLFPAYPPVVTTNINDVVTGAIDGRYHKDRG